MSTSYTSLLGVALPATGENSGAWGTLVNTGITQLFEDAIAGNATLSTDADVTLTITTGASNQARMAVLTCSGVRTAQRNITAPAQSKAYYVINNTTGGFGVNIRGAGPTTGVVIANGEKAVVLWSGTDFVKLGSSLLGTVTTFSVAAANGFSGSVANATTTPQLTLTTSITGVIKGAAGALAAAVAGTDYQAPIGTISGLAKGNGANALTVAVAGTDYQAPLASGTNIKTINGASVLGSGDLSLVLTSSLTRSARISNTMLDVADRATLIDITSGTFAQTFNASAALGAGWWCYIRNSGTGDVTLTPNGVETVDGLTSFVMYPGEIRLVQCDGTTLRTCVLHPFYRVFTATGTFTTPPGYSQFSGIAWSGGASGQKSTALGSTGIGGGGGGAFPFTFGAATMGASQTITIGAGGAASTGAASNTGGDTTIGSLLTVKGASGPSGSGGAVMSMAGAATQSTTGLCIGFEAPASTSNGNSSIWGGGNPSNIGATGSGGSIYGGGAGGSVDSGNVVRLPGSSLHGGSGGAASSLGVGSPGTAPAGGGGATQTGATSGAGARGEVRIWGIC